MRQTAHKIAVEMHELNHYILDSIEDQAPLHTARHLLLSWEAEHGTMDGVVEGMSDSMAAIWRRRISAMNVIMYDKGVGHDMGIHRPFDGQVGAALTAVSKLITTTISEMLAEIDKEDD